MLIAIDNHGIITCQQDTTWLVTNYHNKISADYYSSLKADKYTWVLPYKLPPTHNQDPIHEIHIVFNNEVNIKEWQVPLVARCWKSLSMDWKSLSITEHLNSYFLHIPWLKSSKYLAENKLIRYCLRANKYLHGDNLSLNWMNLKESLKGEVGPV